MNLHKNSRFDCLRGDEERSTKDPKKEKNSRFDFSNNISDNKTDNNFRSQSSFNRRDDFRRDDYRRDDFRRDDFRRDDFRRDDFRRDDFKRDNYRRGNRNNDYKERDSRSRKSIQGGRMLGLTLADYSKDLQFKNEPEKKEKYNPFGSRRKQEDYRNDKPRYNKFSMKYEGGGETVKEIKKEPEKKFEIKEEDFPSL